MEMRHAVRQHLHALDGRGARILYHNAIDPAPPWVIRTTPDLCILHTTFLCARWFDDFETYRRRFRWISGLHCPKIALPQDEYDHAGLLEEWLLELGVTSVHSCFGPEERSTLYPMLGRHVRFHDALTGYIDEVAAAELSARIVPHSKRALDIVYRATKLPYWFGSHGQLKHRIAEVVQARAREFGFATDISTRWEDTIFGERWLDFVMSGRAIIGCESGSSVLDPRGEIQRRIRGLLLDQPDLTFEDVDALLPTGWDSYAFFAISPRHLEAVITKTAQVLVEGSYSGVLHPERHYIPLRRDFSNLDEAFERLRDVEAVEAMAERAYRDVFLDGHNTLAAFAEQLRGERRPQARSIGVPFALATRLPVPTLPPAFARRRPLRARGARSIPLLLTLLDGLAREPEARRLLIHSARSQTTLPIRDVVRDIILLRVIARIRREGGGMDAPWSLSVENARGTITIKTDPGSTSERHTLLDDFESVVWNHSAVARTVPIFPRRPRWGSIAVGQDGRYEFRSLGATGINQVAARELLARTLGTVSAPR
jgi:hypothetical protein